MDCEWTWINGVSKHIRNHLDVKSGGVTMVTVLLEVEETNRRLVRPSSATYQNKAPPSLASFAQRKGHGEFQKRHKSMKNGSFKILDGNRYIPQINIMPERQPCFYSSPLQYFYILVVSPAYKAASCCFFFSLSPATFVLRFGSHSSSSIMRSLGAAIKLGRNAKLVV